MPQHGKRRNQPPTPDFEAWLVQAKKNHPLMTADEEILKGRDVKAMNEVLLELEQQGKTKDDASLAQRRIIKRGLRARERFVMGNIRLVVSVAQKWTHTKAPFEDLFSEGIVGLHRAAELFDFERGYKFSTYAYWWIRQGIHRNCSNQAHCISVPSSWGDVMKKVNEFIFDYKAKFGVLPTEREILANSPIKGMETLRAYVNLGRGVASLNQHAMNGSVEATEIIDLIQCPKNPAEHQYSEIEFDQIIDVVESYGHSLTDPAQQMIFFNMFADEPQTLASMAKELNVSRERVRQIRQKLQTCIQFRLNKSGVRNAA